LSNRIVATRRRSVTTGLTGRRSPSDANTSKSSTYTPLCPFASFVTIPILRSLARKNIVSASWGPSSYTITWTAFGTRLPVTPVVARSTFGSATSYATIAARAR
jgi:hypothetical protein